MTRSGFPVRVSAALEAVAAWYAGKTVGAMTRAGFNAATLLDRLAIPHPAWLVRDGRWELTRHNDTAHLG